MYEFLYSRDFRISLAKLPKQAAYDIKVKLQFLQKTENPLLFAKNLKGYKDLFRFRVGTYRIVFRIERRNVILLLAKHRKDVYAGF